MQISQIGFQQIASYFGLAVVIIGGAYKLIVWLLERRDRAEKERREQLKIDRSETADLQKFNVEKLIEIIELKELELAHHQDVLQQKAIQITNLEKAAKSHEVLISKQYRLLREHRRDIEKLESLVADEKLTELFTRIKTQIDDYEKLLE